MTPNTEPGKGCGPAAMVIVFFFIVLGIIGQACEGDSPEYIPSGDTGCANAAAAQELRGYDYDSEYEACVKIKEITGD